jgi:hypothetical protein
MEETSMRKLLPCSPTLRLWLVGAFFFGAAGAARAQDRILYNIPGRPATDVTVVVGKIVDENAKRVVIKPNAGANREVAVEGIIEVYYQLPANKAAARANYQKAEALAQDAARTQDEAKRKKLLGDAITMYSQLQKDMEDSKMISRHFQFKVASLSAQKARGDRELTMMAIDLLEKFTKDNADTWQNHFASKLLEELKGKK